MTPWRDDDNVFLPSLLELYLQENGISKLGGAGVFSRACPILDKVDLKLNSLSSIADIQESLRNLEHVTAVTIQDNPVLSTNASSAALTTALLQTLPSLASLNGSSVSDDAKWGAIATLHASSSLHLHHLRPSLLSDAKFAHAASVWGTMRSATTICGICDQVRSRQRRNNCKVYNNGRAKLTPIRRCPSGRPSCAPSALLRCPQPRRHPSPSTGTRASEAKRAQARKS